jgi:hypothetical protein
MLLLFHLICFEYLNLYVVVLFSVIGFVQPDLYFFVQVPVICFVYPDFDFFCTVPFSIIHSASTLQEHLTSIGRNTTFSDLSREEGDAWL